MAEETSRRRNARAGGWLLLHLVLSTAAFFLFGGYRNFPYKVESDGKYYYQFLLSAWFDHDLDFSNNYAVPKKPFMRMEIDHYGFADRLSPTGRPTNFFTPGPAVLWSPFIAAVGVGQQVASPGTVVDGWERPVQYAVMLSAVAYSAFALVMLWGLLRRHFSEPAVLASLAMLFWGTNWLYYTVFEPSMSHVYDLFTLVLVLAAGRAALDRGTAAAWAVVGLSAGLHVLVRPQNLVTVAIFAGVAVRELLRGHAESADRSRAGWRSLAALGICFFLALVPLLLSNRALFGSALALPQGEGFLDLRSPEILSVLFSGRNGLFSHHPVLLLGAVGCVIAWRRAGGALRGGLLLPLSLAFGAQLWINASTADWWSGHAFGQRRLLSSLPLFAIGFCALIDVARERLRRGGGVVAAMATVFIVLNLELTAIHVFLWSYDEPHNVARWLFVQGPVELWSRFISPGG